ncbi:AAA family ATPase [Parvimonas micra]
MGIFTIDRTINFNEEKVLKTLEIIDQSVSDEEIENQMITQGIVSLRKDTDRHGFFRRRWITFLKEFNLYDGENITAFGRQYLEKKISTRDYLLIFLVNRMSVINGEKISPLFELIKITRELDVRNENTSISEDELKYFCSTIKNNSNDEVLRVVNDIVKWRKGLLTEVKEYCPVHYDIWRNLLYQIDLSESETIRINLNSPLTKWIEEYYRLKFEVSLKDIRQKTVLEEFIEYFNSTKDQWLKNEINEIKERNEFLKEYPIDFIKNMLIDEYVSGLGPNKKTLCYDLEFGKYKSTGAGIRGGSALKFGVYYSKNENNYKYKNKVISPSEFWNNFRTQLYDFLHEEIQTQKAISTKIKYPLLDGLGMLLGKLSYLYCGDMFISIVSKDILQDLLDAFGYSYDKNMEVQELNYLLNKNIRNDFPSIVNYGQSVLGSSLWGFYTNVLHVEKQNIQIGVDTIISNPIQFDTGYSSKYPLNRIVFGAPGTGKSFILNENRKDLLGENQDINYERVTFHPDYSYSHFVGTYKPVPIIGDDGKESISYEYVPGPFMRVYVEALRNSRSDNIEPFLVIIEEINRANVASVFGDIFQLLDRDENGISEYPIQASEDIKKFLAKELDGPTGNPENYTKIRIPNNMYIWATMNSADQGVFPMDTAFKRRWDFTYIGIDQNEKELIGKTVLLGTNEYKKRIEWNQLRKAINKFLANNKINEDKQLGPYFIARKIAVPEPGDEIDRDSFISTFKNKVIMYLFDDAAKQRRSSLFSSHFSSGVTRYSEICNKFDEIGIHIFCDEILEAVNSEDNSEDNN